MSNSAPKRGTNRVMSIGAHVPCFLVIYYFLYDGIERPKNVFRGTCVGPSSVAMFCDICGGCEMGSIQYRLDYHNHPVLYRARL